MQRVSAFLPAWEKRNSGANKPAGIFSWAHRSSHAHKLPSSINIEAANAHRIQREAFWPASLDLECDKAARIVKSFCSDGYLAPDDAASPPSEPPPSPVLIPKKIPKRIIQNAAGIAVFSCMRSGLWMTGSGGSGILIARKSDGTWSPPSGIMLHTPTLSFIIGVDMYDCVLVIKNLAALESITRPRVTLGEDVGLTNGPSVPLPHADDTHVSWRDFGNTVLAYMKARGRHQSVKLNGCILAERTNENERFYNGPVSQMDILAGNVVHSVDETKPLFEVIKMAEGRSDFDASVIENISFQSAPGDAVIATPMSTTTSPRPSFGIPKADDPDPYGVLALEMAGLEIREAGTRLRPTSSQFDFNPAPLSPSLSKFSRQSVETFLSRSNRASFISSRTTKSQVTDACTQTDVANTPETTPSPSSSDDGKIHISHERMPDLREDDEFDYTQIDVTSLRLSRPDVLDLVVPCRLVDDGSPDTSPSLDANDKLEDIDTNGEDDMDDNDADEAVVFEAMAAAKPTSTQAIASRVIHAKGNVVTIPKRLPPPLPKKSPARNSRLGKSDAAAILDTAASTTLSLLRHALDGTDGSAETSRASDYKMSEQPSSADEGRQHLAEAGVDANAHELKGDETLSGQQLRPASVAANSSYWETPSNDSEVTTATGADPLDDGWSYHGSSLTSDRSFTNSGGVTGCSDLIKAEEQQQLQKNNKEEDKSKEESQLSSEASQTAVAVA